MVTRTLATEQDRMMLIRLIEGVKLPSTVEITAGKKRSTEQNKLQRKWMTEIAKQLGEGAEHWRAYCKLHFGVPIMRNESEGFCAAYDAHVRHLPYETKLAYMAIPLDMPVTRMMKTKQKSEYLDMIYRHFTEQGVYLTAPDMRGFGEAA
jgi:hypothetical protein